MKIILIPILKYFFTTFIAILNLIFTIFSYILITLWELKYMSWGEYLVYTYSCEVESPKDSVINILIKERFINTIKRWINFEYTIFM